MTIPVGEPIRISASEITDFDGTELAQADITSAQIDIRMGTAAPVVASTPMTWSDTNDQWEYVWDTRTVPAGTYRVRITVTPVAGLPSFKDRAVVLSRKPA